MEYLLQKVSYLKGLADGLGVEDTSKEGKLLLHIVDTMQEFVDVLDDSIENQLALEEYVEFIDEDLAEVEDDIYGSDEFDEDDFDLEEFYADHCCEFDEDEDEEDED